MVQTSPTPTTEVARSLAPWQLGVLVAAPVVALAARLLNTPWYQNDDDTPDNARFLSEVASSTGANDVGAFLTLLSGMLYVAAVVVLGLWVRSRMPRTATIGLVLGAIGGFGLVAFADQLMIIGQAARLDEHRGAMIALLQQSYDSPQAGLSYLLLVVGALGWILLGVVLYRSRAVPRAAAVLAAIGGAGVMVTATGPAISFIAGAAVISLAGLVWVAASARRR
jgi:uncharacterized membrane protein